MIAPTTRCEDCGDQDATLYTCCPARLCRKCAIARIAKERERAADRRRRLAERNDA